MSQKRRKIPSRLRFTRSSLCMVNKGSLSKISSSNLSLPLNQYMKMEGAVLKQNILHKDGFYMNLAVTEGEKSEELAEGFMVIALTILVTCHMTSNACSPVVASFSKKFGMIIPASEFESDERFHYHFVQAIAIFLEKLGCVGEPTIKMVTVPMAA